MKVILFVVLIAGKLFLIITISVKKSVKMKFAASIIQKKLLEKINFKNRSFYVLCFQKPYFL